MKRFFLFFVGVLLVSSQMWAVSSAKTVQIVKNGTNYKKILYNLPSGNSGTTPNAIDMGTGVAWADRNVGASSPTGKGNYYVWGTTTTKTNKTATTDAPSLGTSISANNSFTSSTTNDAASAQAGSTVWQVPTKDEANALVSCSKTLTGSGTSKVWTLTSKNGNGATLQYPATGYYGASSSYGTPSSSSYPYFWTKTVKTANKSAASVKAYYADPSASSVSSEYNTYYAMPIRAVYKPSFTIYTLTITAGTATYTFYCESGQSVTVNATTGNTISGWSGSGCTRNGNTFTVNNNGSYTATIVADGYTVTVATGGNGTASATNGSETATTGTAKTTLTATSVNLTATPSNSSVYEFDYWKEGSTTKDWPASKENVSVSANVTFTAYFKKRLYTPTIESNNDLYGSATSDADSYEYNATATLTATPETGYAIQKWQKNGFDIPGSEGYEEIEVTITAADTYTAVFQVAASNWTITATAGANGSVSPNGAQEYADGAEVVITATPDAGYRFLKWVDESSNEVTDNPLGFLASTAKTFTAQFVALAAQTDVIYQDIEKNGRNYDYSFDESEYFTLTVIGNGKNTYKCLNGQQITISVAHEADWEFSKWDDEDTSNPRTFTVGATATRRAIFVPSPGTAATGTSSPSIPAHDATIYQNNASNGGYELLAATASVSGAVDLGLSVLWGTSNVTNGGTGFFSWGQANDTKTDYSSTGYDNGSVDIATSVKGNPWRMPTRAEWAELSNACTWSGNTGTSSINDNTISFPVGGRKYGSNGSVMSSTYHYYWTADVYDASNAYYKSWGNSAAPGTGDLYNARSDGMFVRAVYPAPSPRFTFTVGTNQGAAVNKYIMDANNNTITIYAQPKNDGSRFVQWNDGNTDNPRTFTLTENTTVTAQFTAYAGTTAAAGNWETAATWNNSIRPSATANATVSHAVTIGDGVDNVEVFQSFAKANTLTASAALTVKSGAYLTATNMVVNNTVTLKSGSNTTLSGLTINAGGNLVIEDGANVTLPATVTNKGTLTTAKNLSITTLQQEGGSYAGAGTITVGTLNNTAAWNITSLGNLSVGTLVNTSTLTIGADAVITLGTLTTTSGTTTLAPTAALKLTSGVNAAAANLVLQSSAAGNAQLILPTSGTIQPYATVQLYTGAKREGSVYTWQHFGVPTTGTGAAWTRSQAVDTWVYNWDPQDQWANAEYASASELFATPFQGHNLTNVSDGGVVYTFTGQTVGNIASAFDFVKKGWNHLANSYTATVSLEDILNAMPSDVEASVYTYDGGAMHQATLGEIQGGEATVTNLKPMQAFFLHATAEGVGQQDLSYGTIVVDPTVANAPRRMVAPDYTGRVFITATSNSGVADQVKLREAAEWSSSVWNNMDGSKLIANGHGIYAINNGRLAAFATDNLVGTTLGFTAGTDSEYTLTFSNILGEAYTLLDNQTGARVEMKAGESYTFNAEPKSVNEARFIIVERRNTPTALDEVETLQGVQKFVENGNVIILKDGVRYNVLGTQMQ